MKRAALALAFACAALPAANVWAQPIYACPRYDGSTSYQSTPCVGMPSGQQPIVTAPYSTGAHIRRATEDWVQVKIDAFEQNLHGSGVSEDCQRYLLGILRRTPLDARLRDGSPCAQHPAAAAALPAADAVDAAAR